MSDTTLFDFGAPKAIDPVQSIGALVMGLFRLETGRLKKDEGDVP